MLLCITVSEEGAEPPPFVLPSVTCLLEEKGSPKKVNMDKTLLNSGIGQTAGGRVQPPLGHRFS